MTEISRATASNVGASFSAIEMIDHGANRRNSPMFVNASEVTPEIKLTDLIYLLDMKMSSFGKVRSGTYNIQDPTFYKKVEGWVEFRYSPFTKVGYPGLFKVYLNDCTWGIEIKVCRENGTTRLKFYNEMNGKVRIDKGTKNEIKKFLKYAIFDGEWSFDKPNYDKSFEIVELDLFA